MKHPSASAASPDSPLHQVLLTILQPDASVPTGLHAIPPGLRALRIPPRLTPSCGQRHILYGAVAHTPAVDGAVSVEDAYAADETVGHLIEMDGVVAHLFQVTTVPRRRSSKSLRANVADLAADDIIKQITCLLTTFTPVFYI